MHSRNGHFIGHEKVTRRGLAHRLFFFALIVAGVVAVTVSGCGRHHRWDHKDFTPAEMQEHMEKRAERVMKMVDATPEQREKIKAVLDGFSAEMVKFRDERKALKDRFKAAVEADALDEAELSAIRTATKELVVKATDRAMEVVFEISKVLTPEQRKKLIDSWEKRK